MSEELREALAAANVTPLIQKQIDPNLLEYVRRYSPLVTTLPTVEWGSTVYYFNERSALGGSNGGFVTDGGANSVTTSTYAQNSFTVKLLQNVGSVTGFAQAVTRDLIGDLKAKEVEGSALGMTFDIENAFLWGNATATANGKYPQWDGFDTLVSDFSGSGSSNSKDEAGSNLTLAMLDTLIDSVEENAAMPLGSDWIIVCSPKMVSTIGQLQTTNQRFIAPQVEVATGLNVLSYRDLGLVKSSYLSGRGLAGPTIASSGTAGFGGSLASSQAYYYQVAAVMSRFGETLPSVPAGGLTMTTASTASSTVTFTVTSPATTLDSATAILYKVYRGTTASSLTLLGVVDGFDTGGTAASAIIDTGSNLQVNSASVTGPTAYVGGNTGILPRATGSEDIFLIPKNEDFLVVPTTREMNIINLAPTTSAPDTLPFALVSDKCVAIRAPKYVGRLRNVKTTI